MLRVVIDGVGRGYRLMARDVVCPRIEVPIKARKVAAADLKSDPVSFAEDVAGCPDVDGKLVRLTGIQQSGLLLRVAVAGAEDAFRQILREAIGADVYQFGGEIGIDRGRASEEFDTNRPGDFEILGKRGGGVDEHIVAGFDRALVAGAGLEMLGVATQWTADGRRGILGIVDVTIG